MKPILHAAFGLPSLSLAARGAETRNRRYYRVERWRPDIRRVNAVTRAIILLAKGRFENALKIARDNKGGIKSVDGHLASPQELASVLLKELQESLAISAALPANEDSLFRREGDYWTISYDGQIARLKVTRGLHCLACLLSHPRREFHVSELIAELADARVLATVKTGGQRDSGLLVTSSYAQSLGPILDARSKNEYRCRLDQLREELEETERFNDLERGARVQDEMNFIATQIASAVGLGTRDRPTGSAAERARSAVTKRIKESITKIEEIIPSLGRHLAARIKTGYFCSYNPYPDHTVAWKF